MHGHHGHFGHGGGHVGHGGGHFGHGPHMGGGRFFGRPFGLGLGGFGCVFFPVFLLMLLFQVVLLPFRLLTLPFRAFGGWGHRRHF